jgi:hypothetical protein
MIERHEEDNYQQKRPFKGALGGYVEVNGFAERFQVNHLIFSHHQP